MHLADLIRDVVKEKVEKTFVGKNITIYDFAKGTVTFDCAYVDFVDDGRLVCLYFEDTEENEYCAGGQGLDIWYIIN